MNSLTPSQIEEILKCTQGKRECSDDGYFSKPFRVFFNDEEIIVKTFLPIRKKTLVDYILQNHSAYYSQLRVVGIKIPVTFIQSIVQSNTYQIVIIQQPFAEDEMIRKMIAKATLHEITEICKLLFTDVIKYISFEKPSAGLGFHPSLRNYALRQGELWYFDTFPPMMMSQKELNRVIIAMSPYGRLIKKITPQRFINRVTNEYYFVPRMFSGIVGSCCRLRPELADEILIFCKDYISASAEINEKDKQQTLELLKTPPHLSKLWLLWRRLSGKSGKPNV